MKQLTKLSIRLMCKSHGSHGTAARVYLYDIITCIMLIFPVINNVSEIEEDLSTLILLTN